MGDEPTNYLDREGPGALVLAIKDYKGGVLIISHNKEFCDGVAQEKWIMNKGYLRIEGESVDTTKEDEDGGNKVEDIVDASGNKIEQNAVDNSSDKDKKKKLKDVEKKQTLTDEEKWALEDQILELKEKLEAKK